jgi:uncharacterized membrane protein
MQMIGWIQRLFGPAVVLWALALPAAASMPTSSRSVSVRLVSGTVYTTGAVLCHQRPDRSFHWGDHAWPVCARCTGIYEGAAGGVLLILGMMRRRRRSAAPGSALGAPFPVATDVSRTRMVVLMSVVPTLLTLAWEWTTGSTPSNLLRAVAGVPIGIVVAWVVLCLSRRDAQSG